MPRCCTLCKLRVWLKHRGDKESDSKRLPISIGQLPKHCSIHRCKGMDKFRFCSFFLWLRAHCLCLVSFALSLYSGSADTAASATVSQSATVGAPCFVGSCQPLLGGTSQHAMEPARIRRVTLAHPRFTVQGGRSATRTKLASVQLGALQPVTRVVQSEQRTKTTAVSMRCVCVLFFVNPIWVRRQEATKVSSLVLILIQTHVHYCTVMLDRWHTCESCRMFAVLAWDAHAGFMPI